MFHDRSRSPPKEFCHWSFSVSQHHILRVTIFFEIFAEIWKKTETQVSSYPQLWYVIRFIFFLQLALGEVRWLVDPRTFLVFLTQMSGLVLLKFCQHIDLLSGCLQWFHTSSCGLSSSSWVSMKYLSGLLRGHKLNKSISMLVRRAKYSLTQTYPCGKGGQLYPGLH